MVSQPKKPAAAMMKSRLIVCLIDSQKTFGRAFRVKSLYKKPRNNAYREAMTAASVGVNHPTKIPPIMMTGVSKGKNASLILATISLKSALFALGKLYRFAKNAMAPIMATAINDPGIKPARKSLLTDTPVNAP